MSPRQLHEKKDVRVDPIKRRVWLSANDKVGEGKRQLEWFCHEEIEKGDTFEIPDARV